MDLNKQKDALLALQAEYNDLLSSTRGRDSREQQNSEAPVMSDIPTHDADVATVLFERERDEAFVTDYQVVLRQIDRALQKIEEGTYGKSDVSGQPIPEERLEVQPYALVTVEEQEMQEA